MREFASKAAVPKERVFRRFSKLKPKNFMLHPAPTRLIYSDSSASHIYTYIHWWAPSRVGHDLRTTNTLSTPSPSCVTTQHISSCSTTPHGSYSRTNAPNPSSFHPLKLARFHGPWEYYLGQRATSRWNPFPYCYKWYINIYWVNWYQRATRSSLGCFPTDQ